MCKNKSDFFWQKKAFIDKVIHDYEWREKICLNMFFSRYTLVIWRGKQKTYISLIRISSFESVVYSNMETDVDDILGEYSDDIHEEFRDDNSHSIYNNNSLHFISNSTSVRLVSFICQIIYFGILILEM